MTFSALLVEWCHVSARAPNLVIGDGIDGRGGLSMRATAED